MTVYYLDSSVAVGALLRQSPPAVSWIDRATSDSSTVVVSSRILRTEITRALRRESQPVSLRDEIIDQLDIVPLTPGVIAAAEAIEPHVRTLDAIHLGSLIASGLDAVVVTSDAQMSAAAKALGYRTFDPAAQS